MKSLSIAILSMSLFLTGQQFASAQEGVVDGFAKVKSYEGNFTIKLPKEPEYSSSDIETDIGTVKMHTFAVESADQKTAYFLFYSDYPKGTADKVNTRTLLSNAQGGILKDGSTKTREVKIQVGEYPGVEFDFEKGEGADKTFATWRLYMVQDRLYQIGILSIGKPVDASKQKTIYDSFDLLKK